MLSDKMPPAKKAKRKSKPPTKLKEFLCDDNIEKGELLSMAKCGVEESCF